jgi:MtN3 and saliva related transmembrane protein
MDMTLTVGLTAAFLTTIAFLPQALKIWRTKSAKDVSLHTFLAFTVGVALWLVYGILKQELPIILSNGITLALASAILTMKLRYG